MGRGVMDGRPVSLRHGGPYRHPPAPLRLRPAYVSPVSGRLTSRVPCPSLRGGAYPRRPGSRADRHALRGQVIPMRILSALRPPGLSTARRRRGPVPPVRGRRGAAVRRAAEVRGILFLRRRVDLPTVGRWLAFAYTVLGVSRLREPLRRQRCPGSVSSFRVADAAVRGRASLRPPSTLPRTVAGESQWGQSDTRPGVTRCAALVPRGCAGRLGSLLLWSLDPLRARRLPS